MYSFDFYCGIDISKDYLDCTLINSNNKKLHYIKVAYNSKGMKKILNHCKKYDVDFSKTLFCCENTGSYTDKLSTFLYKNKCKLWVENALKILKSQGLTRGKNDSIDSFRIAQYALRFKDRCKLYQPNSESLDKLKHLFALRDRLQKAIKALEVPLNEAKKNIKKKSYEILKSTSKDSLEALKKDLKKVELELENTISSDDELQKNYKLSQTVPYIGKVSAMYLLLSTNNFTKIKTYRKAACYAGIAPFEHSSGTSIRGKTRVSNMANKNLKKILHMSSLSILKHKKGELYEYFERKIKEGKHTMSVLNSLRNKLLSRVFACVNNGVEYQADYANKYCK